LAIRSLRRYASGLFDYTTTVDVPAWVDVVSVFADPTFQLTNTSGSDILMSLSTFIDGGRFGFTSHEAVNNQTQSLTLSYGADLTGVAGSSVTVGMRVLIQGASNSDNHGILSGLMIGRR